MVFDCPPGGNCGNAESEGCDWDDCDKCWKKYFKRGTRRIGFNVAIDSKFPVVGKASATGIFFAQEGGLTTS